MNWLLGYVHHVLVYGIKLGNYCLKFLSYSNSQIKSHSCWFLAYNIYNHKQNLTDEKIMESMGDFSNEKNILKKYARRGQCFSTTKHIMNIDQDEIEIVKDIINNGFTFTDGCGKVSSEIAEIIAHEFGLQKASAFQIRIGGAKGVLMESKDLTGRMVVLRDSQIKFKSNDLGLNVVRCATYSQGYLNRQVIILLNCLGVPAEVFLKL